MAIFNSYVKLPEGTWLVSHCHVWCSVFVCDCCADLCKKDPGRRPFRGSYDGWMISYFWCFHQCPIPFVDWRLNVVLPGCFSMAFAVSSGFRWTIDSQCAKSFREPMDLETDCSLKHFLNRLHPSSPHPDHLIHAHGVAIQPAMGWGYVHPGHRTKAGSDPMVWYTPIRTGGMVYTISPLRE